jgi:hypothetical protein
VALLASIKAAARHENARGAEAAAGVLFGLIYPSRKKIPMRKLAIPNRNHKNRNGPHASDLAGAIDAALDAAESIAMRDAYLEIEIGKIRQCLCSIDAQLLELQQKIRSFHTEQ